MDSNEKIVQQDPPTRRKFVWAFGVLSFFAAVAAATGFSSSLKKNIMACGPEEKVKKTVKMLTQDGKLVEVDASLLAVHKKKITDTELQNWIKQ